MGIGIDDLDDDLMVQDNPDEQLPSQLPTFQLPNYLQNQEPENQDDDFMLEFLRSKGIEDPSKIKFEDENGNIEERDWNSLSREEQINILNTPIHESQAPTEGGNVEDFLTDDEINLINSIRTSRLSPKEYLNNLIQEYQTEPTYKVDDLSDDEVFILDLESRVGELNEEEAAQALANAKQNEELYKKLVEGIRKEYQLKEEEASLYEQELLQQQLLERFNLFSQSVIESIKGFNSIGNLDLNLEDADREELAAFMLTSDDSGNNYLRSALQDPEILVKAAWFILNGEEALNNVTDYFTNLIKLVSENQYKKGFLDGKNGTSSKPSLVFKKNETTTRPKYSSINDLDD